MFLIALPVWAKLVLIILLINAVLNTSPASWPEITPRVTAPDVVPNTLAIGADKPKSFKPCVVSKPTYVPAPPVKPDINISLKSPPRKAVVARFPAAFDIAVFNAPVIVVGAVNLVKPSAVWSMVLPSLYENKDDPSERFSTPIKDDSAPEAK